jgi:osmotically-inducible protein OsmY
MKNLVLLITVVILFGCTPKDSDIKKSIAISAKEDLMYAGVNYDVHNGIVTLSGNSPSEELKNKLIKRLQSTGGVKNVVDNITIGPVVLNNDFVLKQKVDSVLSSYASVESTVQKGVVTLNGSAKKDEANKVVQSLQQLPVVDVRNNLSIR